MGRFSCIIEMMRKTRHERPLSSLRRTVRRIYEKHGYKVLTWLEGACPDKVEKTKKATLPDYAVLDLVLDHLARENGKEPNKDPDKRPYRSKNKFRKPGPSPKPISRLAPRGRL